MRFYLNGRFDKETRQSVAHPARLGPARIGNWDQQDRKLSGRIDEEILVPLYEAVTRGTATPADALKKASDQLDVLLAE